MARVKHDFWARPEADHQWFLDNTWCDNCNQADLGMSDPVEFEEDGRVYIEGKCLQCGGHVISELTEKEIAETAMRFFTQVWKRMADEKARSVVWGLW